MEKKLPKNWVETELDSLFSLAYGKGLSVKELIPNGEYNVYGANSIIGKYNTFNQEKSKVIISCRGAASGAIHKTIPKSFVTSNSIVLDAYSDELLLPNYVKYFMTSADKSEIITGTAQPQITIQLLKKLNFCFPPLAEQQRIVAKLDELFGHLDTLKTRLTNIPQILKKFRQAVLTQAVTGKLTEEWRVGKELEEWNSLKIEEVIESLNQGWSPKCESFPSTDNEIWGVIKTSSVQPLRFIEHENKQLPIHLEPRKQHELIPGDLLITRAGPRVRVGIASLVKKVRPRLMICDKVYRLRVNKKIIKSEFLEIILNSPQILAVIEIMKTGISDSGLNLTQTKFKSIEFNLPAIEEQTEIVKRVEDLFSKANIIEVQYQNLKTKIDSLPQAILAKAFKGELVAQLATDGDAKELLEEIQKLRESLVKEPVKKKKK